MLRTYNSDILEILLQPSTSSPISANITYDTSGAVSRMNISFTCYIWTQGTTNSISTYASNSANVTLSPRATTPISANVTYITNSVPSPTGPISANISYNTIEAVS